MSASLDVEGKDTLEAMASAALSLASYATAAKALPSAVNQAALTSAPTAAWMQARTEAAARMWLFRRRAQKRLCRQIEAHLCWPVAKATANSLEALAAAQACAAEAQRSLTDLPPGVPARGLETDPARLTALVEAGTRARAALLALVGAGGNLVTVRERMRRVLSDGRDLLEPGMPIPSAAATFATTLAGFLASLATFRNEAALTSDMNVAEAERVAAAIVERTARLNVWCAGSPRRREAEAAGLTAVVSALEQGIIASDGAADAFRTAYCRWAAPLMIDQARAAGFSAVSHEALDPDLPATRSRTRGYHRHISAPPWREAIPAGRAERTAGPRRALQGAAEEDAPQADTPAHRPDGRQPTDPHPVPDDEPALGGAVSSCQPIDVRPGGVRRGIADLTVPDAIGAIARAWVIIVGDPKQMPPTSFFDKAASNDGDGTAMGMARP